MKKVLCVAMMALMSVAFVQAEEAAKTKEVGNIGVGYQGMFLGNMLNGIAVRGKPSPIGWQAEITQGMIDVDPAGGGSLTADMLVLKGKAYYALVERENSSFYAGAGIGYWMANLDPGGGETEVTGWSLAPLIGVEWNFAELPELGLNFEISYELNELEADVPGSGTTDIGIYGINVSTGIIYYF